LSEATVNDHVLNMTFEIKKPLISTNVVDNSVHNTERHHHLSTRFATGNLFAQN